ncbi:MAG: glycosyltransferase family 4 protein [Spirochaetaceae bacterium]
MEYNLKKSDLKTILFLSWRDIKAPKMGGAEIFTHEMLKRMDKKNYRILHYSPLFKDCTEEEEIDGILYIRSGSIFTVISKAVNFYKQNRDKIDYVVNQCNTHRFFTKFWVEKSKRIFFIHQLTRKIWFYHTKFPFSLIGYLLEKPLLKLNKKDLTITVSDSTKKDLEAIGFSPDKISILPEGLSFTPWSIDDFKKKEENPTFIYVGRFAKYKGIDDAIKAFSLVKANYPEAKLWIVGKINVDYMEKQLNPLCRDCGLSVSTDNLQGDVEYKGFVTEEEKLNLMSRAHLLIFPSIREGWGLTISEAAAVGTPSLVYNASGTRDAVQHGESGYMVDIGNIQGLRDSMQESITLTQEYNDIRFKAYELSKTLHWDNTAIKFKEFCDREL